MVTELQKERNFVGQTEEKRRGLEKELKYRYEISDWHEDVEKIGYSIHDKIKDQITYFSSNARAIFEKRYLEKDKKRNVCENALDMFARVAVNIAEADLKYEPESNIKPVAEEFLETLVYKEFMPNTPTLCNAGRALQQLSACFVLPIEDYMATDDIGEDPEKQGEGIADVLRYMAMIHKSGGGTGFSFSNLRPRGHYISTTFGSSSGPVVFIYPFDAMTDAVNQGGFRRGANMGILKYDHPDIFEFISEKARKGTLKNFNLSVGVDDYFMDLVSTDGYFKLINPKNRKTVSLEERVWKVHNLLTKGEPKYKESVDELEPSIVIAEDKKRVLNAYTDEEVGKIDDDGTILISARKLFNYISYNAWVEGCPGIIFLDRLKEKNPTPEIGEQVATNPCGEQPLLPYEACNLGAINLANCVKNNKINYEEIDRRVNLGVHFLDNVIDMSKFPFQKIYEMVHGNRRIGLGLMGWAEMLSQLRIPYDSNQAVELAKNISRHITETARKKSEELAEKRGVFPYWEKSIWAKEGKRVRNAAITTIAPNGTTGMIADCTGGIEPFFKLAYIKTCMDNKKLFYSIPLFEKELREKIKDKTKLEKILEHVREKGSIQEVEGVPEDLKELYKTAHDISPGWHVKIQSAFQTGIDNAVSKTVNMPNSASIEDVKKVYTDAHKNKCIGITIFRDGSKKGVYSGLEKIAIELIQIGVDSSPILQKKAQALKYKVKRPQNNDSLHVTITSDLYVEDKTKKAYFLPDEIFQNRAPLGDAKSVTFEQSGMDRTEIFKSVVPNYSEFIQRLQSASSNEEEGLGPNKIKSMEYAVGVVLEDALLRNGVVKRDKVTGVLFNVVKKSELRKVEEGTDEYNSLMSQVRIIQTEEKEVVTGTNMKLREKFVCENCGASGPEAYTFQAGCHHPVCNNCSWVEGGGCG